MASRYFPNTDGDDYPDRAAPPSIQHPRVDHLSRYILSQEGSLQQMNALCVTQNSKVQSQHQHLQLQQPEYGSQSQYLQQNPFSNPLLGFSNSNQLSQLSNNFGVHHQHQVVICSNVPQPPPPEYRSDRRIPNLKPSVPSEIDKAVDAINALSNLEKRWSTPATTVQRQQLPMAKTTRRKKRRRKNKKNDEPNNKIGSLSKDQVIILHKEEWIDIDEPIIMPHEESRSLHKPNRIEGMNAFPSSIEDNDLPILAPSSKDDDTPKDQTLATYASVLNKCLQLNDVGDNQGSKNEMFKFLHNYEEEEEEEEEEEDMDISDVDDEINQDSDNQEESNLSDVNLYVPALVVNTSDAPDTHDAVNVKKRALKIAELKAKAKLAKAKLLMAEKKKAQGERVMTSSNPPKENKTLDEPDVPLPSILSSSDSNPFDESESFQTEAIVHNFHQDKFVSAPQATISNKEFKGKTLQQKLNLARLQLEIKKKELEKRELQIKQVRHLHEIPPKEVSLLRFDVMGSARDIEYTQTCDQKQIDSIESLNKKELGAKLEQLQQRQKELKQKHDTASLQNLIHRQKGLLQAQRQELIDISSQLQMCITSLNEKHDLLEQSEGKVEEMKHRKRIIEGMSLRAMEQLMAARKSLSERRKQRVINGRSPIHYVCLESSATPLQR